MTGLSTHSQKLNFVPFHVQHFKQGAGHLVVVKIASQPYPMPIMRFLELLDLFSPSGAIGQKKLVFGDSSLPDEHIVAAN